MRHSHKLPSLTPGVDRIEFDWDPDTGEVSGRDAGRVLDVVDMAKRWGEVLSHPWPTVYPITDPARNPTEMAVVLCRYWVLDKFLADAFPAPPKLDAEVQDTAR